MLGFLIAGLATFFWSLVNIIDKALVERFCKEGDVSALVVLSSLFPVVLLPIAYMVTNGQLSIPAQDISILAFSGVLTTAWIYLYFNALNDEDVSTVIPMMQLTPVFALIFSYILLNESPASTGLFAGLIIVIGSLVLSKEQATGKLKIKLLMQMTGISVIIALMNTLFKFSTVEETFWVSIFWHSLGTFLAGLALYLFHTRYRNSFNTFIKQNYGIGISLNGLNETLTLAGDTLFYFAILLAPLALIQTMEAYQPIFVFIIGFSMSKIAPKILNEDFSKAVLTQKAFGIILVLIGSLWMILL